MAPWAITEVVEKLQDLQFASAAPVHLSIKSSFINAALVNLTLISPERCSAEAAAEDHEGIRGAHSGPGRLAVPRRCAAGARVGLTRRGRGTKEPYKDELLKTFGIFGHPFEAVRADDGVSRRDGGSATGRVRPRSAPRGPGDIWEPVSNVFFEKYSKVTPCRTRSRLARGSANKADGLIRAGVRMPPLRKMLPVIRGLVILDDSGEEEAILGERNWILQLGKGCQDPLGGAAAPPNRPAPETSLDLGIC